MTINSGLINPLYLNEKKRVMDKLNNNINKEKLYIMGGWYATAPKFEPKGSFNMPLNLNGNTSYSLKNNFSGGNLLRTQEVQQYYKKILSDRRNQLEALNELSNSNMISKPIESVNTESEEIFSKLQAITNNISSKFYNGEYDKLNTNDISDIYTIFLKKGLLLTNQDLLNFYNIYNEIVNTMDSLSDARQGKRYKSVILFMPKGAGLNFMRIVNLIKGIIGVKNLNFQNIKDSQTAVNNISKIILQSKNPEELLNASEHIDNKLQPKLDNNATMDLEQNKSRIFNNIIARQTVQSSLSGKKIGDISNMDKIGDINEEINKLKEVIDNYNNIINDNNDKIENYTREIEILNDKIENNRYKNTRKGRKNKTADQRILTLLNNQIRELSIKTENFIKTHKTEISKTKTQLTKLIKQYNKLKSDDMVDIDEAIKDYSFNPSKFKRTIPTITNDSDSDSDGGGVEESKGEAGAPVGSGKRSKKSSNPLYRLF
jgi:hypothetical protein